MSSVQDYDDLIAKITRRCADVVPAGAVVLVLSKGDERLLRLGHAVARHFPANERGLYVGHHPSDSRAAVNQLEAARDNGGEYLLIPATAAWWLEFYRGFGTFLAEHCELLAKDESGLIYALNSSKDRPSRSAASKGNQRDVAAAVVNSPVSQQWEPARQLRFALQYSQTLPLVPPPTTFNARQMSLHWIIPDFSRGMGGHAVIFRIIHLLEKFGHLNTIWIRGETHYGTGEKARQAIRADFAPVDAEVRVLTDNTDEISGDAVIATHSWTAYPARAVTHVRRRFYFVQDFEPLFYPMGTESLLAEATYRFGFTCIASSNWLQETLRSKYAAPVERFIYAYDHQVYREDPSIPRSAARIAFYARSSTPRRAVDLGLLALERLVAKGVSFEVDFFGGHIGEVKVPYAYRDHGVLNEHELADLYRRATVGVVFSTTNYSLIPHEMMGCGLPVIDLETPGAIADLPADAVTLAEPSPDGIASAVQLLLSDESLRERQIARARQYVSQLSWEATARRIEQILADQMRTGTTEWTKVHDPTRVNNFSEPFIFVGQPEYYRSVYFDGTSTGEHFEFPITSGDTTSLRNLPRFVSQHRAKTCLIFRPEWLAMYPEVFAELRQMEVGIIGYSTEPVPQNRNHAHADQLRRLSMLRQAQRVPYDLLIHYDPSSMEYLTAAGFTKLITHPLPVSRKLFFPESLSVEFDACFLGRSTPHREEMLASLKSRFNIVHVAHGLRDEEARRLMNRSRVVLNIHNDTYPNFENRVCQALFCGRPVLSERLSEGPLVADRDYVLIESPNQLCASLSTVIRGEELPGMKAQVNLSQFELRELMQRLVAQAN